MKKCPNCGALMENGVNFCTKCGSDLRSITLEKDPEQATTATEKTAPVAAEVNQQHVNSGSYLQNYWEWLVESWKRPADSNLTAQSWYGWLTILIEDVLFVTGLYFFAKSVITGAIGLVNHFGVDTRGWGNFDIYFSIVFRVFLIILIFQVIVIASHFAAYKFIYDEQVHLLDFVNRGVHASNLNLILTVIFFLLMVLGLNSIRFTLFLVLLLFVLFFIGQEVALLANDGARRDKAYGALLAFGIIFVCSLIMNSLIYNSVLRSVFNQIISGFNGSM